MRPYNFSSLPAGECTIEVSDAKGKRSQTISYAMPDAKRIAHLSRLSGEDNTYVLKVPNKGRDVLTIRIFDERNTLLYEGTEIVHHNFAKVYKLERFNGDHTFEIVDQEGKTNRLKKPALSK